MYGSFVVKIFLYVLHHRCSTTMYWSSTFWLQMRMFATGWCLFVRRGMCLWRCYGVETWMVMTCKGCPVLMLLPLILCVACIQFRGGAEPGGLSWQWEALFLLIQGDLAWPGACILLQSGLLQTSRWAMMTSLKPWRLAQQVGSLCLWSEGRHFESHPQHNSHMCLLGSEMS